MTLTKSDLYSIKKVVNDVVSDQIASYHADMAKPEFDKLNQRLDGLETKVDNHYEWLKDDISGLKADSSTTVSKKEFNQLKSKVDKYCPAVD